LQIMGINMSVGIDGFVGKHMIREGQVCDVYVCRSLSDVFRMKLTFFSEEQRIPRTMEGKDLGPKILPLQI
jgi:hypothetical protein